MSAVARALGTAFRLSDSQALKRELTIVAEFIRLQLHGCHELLALHFDEALMDVRGKGVEPTPPVEVDFGSRPTAPGDETGALT